MLEQFSKDFFAPLGLGGGVSLNVHGAVALILLVCYTILFIRGFMGIMSEDKD